MRRGVWHTSTTPTRQSIGALFTAAAYAIRPYALHFIVHTVHGMQDRTSHLRLCAYFTQEDFYVANVKQHASVRMHSEKYTIHNCFRLLGIVCLLAVATPYTRAESQHQSGVAPTYTVYATREGLVGQRTANSHVIQPRDRFVALPSWRVLASNGGYEFQVRVTYKGRSVVLPVWDVGPWNTHDDYWSPERERYGDLPLGMPMAYAAVYQGYNGGLDEFGRTIQDPNGIDIADGAFWDDLGMTRTDKVQVTFLWMGRDPGPGSASEAPARPPAQPPAARPQPAPTQAPAPPEPPPPIPEGALTVDNDGAGYTASQGDWNTEKCGVGSSSTWASSTSDAAQGTREGSWTPTLPGAGFYEVLAYIPKCGRTKSSTTAHYRVTHDGATSDVTLDQQAAIGTWASLGTFHFGGNGDQRVALNSVTGDSGRAVRFDAVAWVERKDSTPPVSRVVSITRKNNGYTIAWDGRDDISGIASFDVQVRQLPNGIWREWQTQTTARNAWFGPDEGRPFAFRSRARDGAGNTEAWRDGDDLTTREATPSP